MRNLNGYLKKTLSTFSIILVLLFLIFPISNKLQADDFSISSEIHYNLDASGKLTVDIYQNITSSETTVIKYYTFKSPHNNISDYYVKKDQKYLEGTKTSDGSTDQLVINFDDTVIKESSPVTIQIHYSISNFVNIDEANTSIEFESEISNSAVTNVQTTFSSDYGKILNTSLPAEISNKASSSSASFKAPNNDSLRVYFGEFLTYNFTINKLFENTDENVRAVEITLPRTQYDQLALYNSISPEPEYSYYDQDGNVFIQYSIEPQSQINAVISGQLILKDTGLEDDLEYPLTSVYTKSDDFWDLDGTTEVDRLDLYLKNKGYNTDPSSIENLEPSIRTAIYKSINEYIKERLSPAQSTVISSRTGAANITTNDSSHSSMDYSDFGVALFRAKGIPARQVSGQHMNVSNLFTEDFQTDWFEIWDEDMKWIKLDPYLEDLSDKSFFDANSLDHISISTRGYDSLKPKITLFGTDELKFDITENTSTESLLVEVTSKDISSSIFDKDISPKIIVKNVGNIPITSVSIELDGSTEVSTLNANQLIMPGESVEFSLNLDNSYNDGNTKLDVPVRISSFSDQEELYLHSISIDVSKPWWITPMSISIVVAGIALIIFLALVATNFISKQKKEKI